MSCPEPPIASVALRYAARRIVIEALRAERDPRLLDLCARHVGAMTPPVGWLVEDDRVPTVLGSRV
jgi:Protein of unknown function (DUF3499)